MPTILPPAKVLVTGASGFVATWVIKELLDEGYSVRGTVRSIGKLEQYPQSLKKEMETGKLEFIEVPDMAVEGAFDDAVRDVDAILHVASPLSISADDPDELIKPAVGGTVGILNSARLHGQNIKRIGITSSTAAIIDETRPGVQDETFWNNNCISEVKEKGRDARPMSKYCASKTLAEKGAWEFVEEHKATLSWDLVTFCMPWVFGPVLQDIPTVDKLSGSMKSFYARVFGNAPQEAGYSSEGNWVDVRDVARGHVWSLKIPEAGGNRFLLTKEPYIWQDWFDVINTLDIAGVNAQLGEPGAGKGFKFNIAYSHEKAEKILGLQFRDKVATAKDIVQDFKLRGWLS